MTGLRPYPAYKESGVDWLDEIPVTWTVVPLMSCVVESRRKNSKLLERNLLSLSYGRIVPKDIDTNDGLLPESFDSYQIVQPDDVVFRLTDLQNDKRSLRSALVGERGIITSAYLAVTPRSVIPRFLAYSMRDTDSRKVFYAMGGGLRQSMNFADMRRLPTLFPSLSEQASIADFLDRETAQIDAFIADQEELIGLLAERRAATISHAVTKGLDPTVPMHDSGVDAIGAIPAHWEVWPFTRFAPHRVDYRGATPTKVDAGILLVTARNVRAGFIDYELSEEFIAVETYDDNMRRGKPELGDILLTMEAPLGNVAAVDRTDVAFAQRLVKFRVKAGSDSRFTVFAMISDYFQQQLLSRATGSTALGIKASKLTELRIAVPTSEEQLSIAAYLEKEAAALDAAIADARDAVALSRERRAALISAAVTGKIDVRDAA